jgi:hypothetical protein
MSDEDLKDELERLPKENAASKKGRSSGIRMKVGEKGALSIYGMGRFPVTLLLAPSYVPPPMPLASRSLPSPTISGDASPIWFRRPLANNPVRTRGTLWEMLPSRAPSESPIKAI